MGTFMLSVTLRPPPTNFLLSVWSHASARWTRELMSGHTPHIARAHPETLSLCRYAHPLTSQHNNDSNAAMKSNLDSVFLRGHKWKWCSISKYLYISSVMWRYCQRGVIIGSIGAGLVFSLCAGQSRKEALLPLCQRAAGLCWTLLQHLHPHISRGPNSRSV